MLQAEQQQQAGPELPDGILEDILNQLNGIDLKTCRLVCRRWNNIIIAWTFQHKTCFEFNGKSKLRRTSWKHHLIPDALRNARLARILTNYLIPRSINEDALDAASSTSNSALAKPWPSLRFKKVSNHQFMCLLSTWTEHMKNSNSSHNQNKKPEARSLQLGTKSEISVFKNMNQSCPQKQIPVLHQVLSSVTKLELINCVLKISTLLKFLSHFKNLRRFIDEHSRYEYFTWSTFCADVDIENSVLAASHERKINKWCQNRTFTPIKSVTIKKPGPYNNTLQILLMWDLTVTDLEEFVLYFNEEDRYPFFSLDYPERLGLFLLKHAKTLLKIEFNWWHTYYELYFEDCLRTIQIFSTSQSTFVLTELILSVQWIFILRDDFQRIFIPIVHRLPCLKKLFLSKIMFEPTTRTIQVLKELIGQPDHKALAATSGSGSGSGSRKRVPVPKPSPHPDLDFTFGLFVCDPMNEDRVMNGTAGAGGSNFDPRRVLVNNQLMRTTRELLKDPIMKRSMISLHLAFDLSYVTCVEQLLPLHHQQQQQPHPPTTLPEVFDHVKELNITSTRNASYSKQFNDYHLDMLMKSFPNLVKLGIFDGPQFLYADKIPAEMEQQYNNMSNAVVGNEQIQLILKTLTRLKSLKLRVNLIMLTDAGLTGIKNEVCQDLYENNNAKTVAAAAAAMRVEDKDRDGVSLSNLPVLEEVMFKGLPSSITSVTAFHAFNGCSSLKQIILCGQFQFTKEADDYLKKLSFKNKFKLQLNTP